MGWAHRIFSFESAGQLEAWFLARKWLEFNSLSQIKGVNKLANAYLFFARLNFGISLISMRPRRLYRNLFSCKSPMMHGKSASHSLYLHLKIRTSLPIKKQQSQKKSQTMILEKRLSFYILYTVHASEVSLN